MIAVSPSAEEYCSLIGIRAARLERPADYSASDGERPRPAPRRARRSSPTAGWARWSRPRRRGSAARRRRTSARRTRSSPLHLSFINAGAELIETNTFGANRPQARRALPRGRARARSTRPASSSPATRARSRAARSSSPARSARSASTRRRGPRTAAPLFAEQAALLAGRGVDLFMVETFFDLDELVTAIDAVRSVSSLPIVAMMTFGEDAETIGGVGAAEAAERLPGLGVAAIGANHGAGPALGARPRSRRCGDGLAARGDAEHRPREHVRRPGRSTRTPRPSTSPSSPRTRATLGATVIGGCCGTTPTEIAAIRGALDEQRAPARAARGRRARAGGGGRARASARRAWRPTSARAGSSSRSSSTRRSARTTPGLLEVAAAIHDAGIGAYVDVNDNATARVGMNPLFVSAAIERTVGIETIPHLTPRDTTVMGLEAVLLGAHAEGIRNVLAVTGDPPEVGDYPGLGRRLRGRLDRAHAPDLAAEPRRELQRQGDRRADLVLHRRRAEPERRRPRPRARPLPPEDRRRRRASR